MTVASKARSWRARSAVFERLDAFVPLSLIVVAAILRLPNLAARGTWDADQGHDMLMLRGLVRDGVVPLLGPPTSIGDVHHGALYYYLLAPAAALTGGDSPLAVVTLIALAGIAAVVVTWWLARSIGGPVAGLVAGVTMAVSASAVDESIFIWNPNLIALSSAVALAGAWQAWSTRRPVWWIVAAIGTAVTMQCHVLGITMLPIVVALLVADARTRANAVDGRRIWRMGLVGLGIIAVSFLPLVVHELTSDFGEIRAALEYIGRGGDPAALGPALRFVVIGIRVVSWPLTGLLTDSPLPVLVATFAVVALTIWLMRSGAPRERQAARWLGLGLLWTTLALTFISPSLATVVIGLPNDHYHAFADPMAFCLVGLGAAAAWRKATAPESSSEATGSDKDPRLPTRAWRLGGSTTTNAAVRDPVPTVSGPAAAVRAPASAVHDPAPTVRQPGQASASIVAAVAAVAVATLLGWNILHQPPSAAGDGGYPAAEAAATHILGITGSSPLTLASIPDFKSTEAYAYPLIRNGGTIEAPTTDGTAEGFLVVICDALFEPTTGKPCAGPAEAEIAPPTQLGDPIDRFQAARGRTISIYRLPN